MLPLLFRKYVQIVFLVKSIQHKPLPDHLKYIYLGENDTLQVIISNKLNNQEEQKLIHVLKNKKEAMG